MVLFVAIRRCVKNDKAIECVGVQSVNRLLEKLLYWQTVIAVQLAIVYSKNIRHINVIT